LLRTDLPALARDAAPAAIPGYHPADLQGAYDLTAASAVSGTGQVLADVLWYDDPNAESDLNQYRSTFGLPPCTTANGCFRKVDEFGGTTYPMTSGLSSLEIALDLDLFSAICPQCKILLVEAKGPSLIDVGIAEDTAARLGATVISNSYGGPETAADRLYDHYFYHHPGIAITAASGDMGYGAGPMYPATSPFVTAVGGTTLTRNPGTTRGWDETAWSCTPGIDCRLLGGAGSGCSTFEPKPSWQSDPLCPQRTSVDVSAEANPFTGVSIYDTVPVLGLTLGWTVGGGTSASAPIIAGVYALAGNAASVVFGSTPYSHMTDLYDVTSGSTGSCGGTYLCTAGPGYDGPTGLGTPNGVGAF
jgi:subtilase family serine protease